MVSLALRPPPKDTGSILTYLNLNFNLIQDSYGILNNDVDTLTTRVDTIESEYLSEPLVLAEKLTVNNDADANRFKALTNGSVGVPAFNFSGVANTGMFASAGLLRFSVSNGERIRLTTTTLQTMSGVHLNITNGGTGAAAMVADFQQGYRIYSDNTGPGSANSRLWIDSNNGGTVYIGPRSGSNSLHALIIRANQLTLEHIGNLAIQLAETNHSIHSASGGVWIRTGTSRVYVYGGSTARVASLHPSSGYVDHWAGTHVDASSRKLKKNIKNANIDAVSIIKKGKKLKKWKYENADIVGKDSKGKNLPKDQIHGRERIGWIAEEAPKEIVVHDSEGNPEGIALGQAVAIAWAAIGDVVERLEALEA